MPPFEISFFFLKRNNKISLLLTMTLQQLKLMFASCVTCLKQLVSSMASGLAENKALMPCRQLIAACSQVAPDLALLSHCLKVSSCQKSSGRLGISFPRQTSKLCLSHLTHTLFFWRGWRWWAAKIQAPWGANYHIEEICLVFQEDNVRHVTHTGSHTHTGWRRHTHTHTNTGRLTEAQMHIVTLKYKKCANTCACTQTLGTPCILTYNLTSGWLSAQVQSGERTRDCWKVAHFPNNLLGPDCTGCISTQRVEVRCLTIHAFIVCKAIEWGIISDTHLKVSTKEKELYGWWATVRKCRIVAARKNSQGQYFHLSNFTTEQKEHQ